MANFQNNVITDVGRVMFGDVQMGKTLIPTKIVIGSGRIPAGKTARTMTEVVSPVTELTISKKQKSNDGTAIFGGVYSNENIESDFYFRELALFAKAGDDGNEVLFSYGNAGETADYMPAYTSGTPVQRVIDLAIYVGNDTKVDLTIEGGLYIPTDEKGVAGGVATLDGDGKVPEDQLPEMNYIPTDEKGVANGVATLGENGKVPKSQLSQDIDAMAESIAQQGKKIETYWKYLESIYDYTCDMPADKSTKPYSYTETLKEADTVKATLVTTMNADGTYTEVYTIGTNPARTRKWSKVDNQWKGVWS